MVLFNYSTKELTAKVVYYGPGLCGKTTNLQWIHEQVPIRNKGKLVSLATESDRTLFFDFLPVHDDGSIVLIRQYRHPAGELLWELPAGRLEPGEDPAAAAHRAMRAII